MYVRAVSTVFSFGIGMYSLIHVSFATLYNSELLTKSCLIVIVDFSIEVQHTLINNVQLNCLCICIAVCSK